MYHLCEKSDHLWIF